MADSPAVTKSLMDMYVQDGWLTRINLKCLMHLSGVQRLDRASKILDCGCGVGDTIRYLQALGFRRIAGFDSDDTFLEMARRSTRAEIIKLDALAIEHGIKEKDFDLVIVSNLLHHLDSHDQRVSVLRGCRRALKTGGLLVIREPWPGLYKHALSWIAHYRPLHLGFMKRQVQLYFAEKEKMDIFYKDWTPAYRRLLSDHGFAIVKDLTWIMHRITVCRKG